PAAASTTSSSSSPAGPSPSPAPATSTSPPPPAAPTPPPPTPTRADGRGRGPRGNPVASWGLRDEHGQGERRASAVDSGDRLPGHVDRPRQGSARGPASPGGRGGDAARLSDELSADLADEVRGPQPGAASSPVGAAVDDVAAGPGPAPG